MCLDVGVLGYDYENLLVNGLLLILKTGKIGDFWISRIYELSNLFWLVWSTNLLLFAKYEILITNT